MPLIVCLQTPPISWIEQSTFVFDQEGKNSLKIKDFGLEFLGHQGPRRRDIRDKNFMRVAFVCCFRQGVAEDVSGFGLGRPKICKTLFGESSRGNTIRGNRI